MMQGENRCEVVVAGGGSAGLAAAVAAARAGARTVLIERHGFLGGMATASLVHSICGLYLLSDEPGAVLAHTGFAAEFSAHLMAEEAAQGHPSAPVRMGRVDVLLQQPAAFARVADRIAAAEPNLEVRLHTELIATEVSEGKVDWVEIICRGRRERFSAGAFVDTTGDATLASMAGAKCEQAQVLQRPAFIFSMGGADTASLGGDGRLKIAQRLVAAVRDGQLPCGVLGAQLRPTLRQGEVFVTIDLDDPAGLPAFDPLSPHWLAGIERYGRELAHAVAAFLIKDIPAFSNAYIAALPARVGIRESRRVVGEVRLEVDDILQGATFPDAVALSTWPVEMREKATGPRLRFPEGNRPCEVPLRALRARGFSNLFTAGRCLSSSHEAQAALRVIGTCLATGEAAGLAAALAASGTEPAASMIRAKREAISRQ